MFFAFQIQTYVRQFYSWTFWGVVRIDTTRERVFTIIATLRWASCGPQDAQRKVAIIVTRERVDLGLEDMGRNDQSQDRTSPHPNTLVTCKQ